MRLDRIALEYFGTTVLAFTTRNEYVYIFSPEVLVHPYSIEVGLRAYNSAERVIFQQNAHAYLTALSYSCQSFWCGQPVFSAMPNLPIRHICKSYLS